MPFGREIIVGLLIGVALFWAWRHFQPQTGGS